MSQKNVSVSVTQNGKVIPGRAVPFRSATILRCRKQLGWTFRGSAYCQLIRKANKAKRLEFARRHLHEAEAGFNDVIFSDEATARATVQLESHRKR